LRKQVIELIREAILSFEYAPGDRLVERDLCERCGVSRTVIREALRHLEAEGLVDIVPNRGPVVVSITREDAEALYETRGVVETAAARLAASRATPDERLELRRALERVEAAYERQHLVDELAAKDDFYGVLLACAHNPILASMLRSLHARTQILRGFSLQEPGRADESLDELQRLVEAVETGDEPAAGLIAAEHVSNAARAGLQRLVDGGSSSSPAAAR
jgi:GntR family transcriptional regulator, trigonelline degradation regulator